MTLLSEAQLEEEAALQEEAEDRALRYLAAPKDETPPDDEQQQKMEILRDFDQLLEERQHQTIQVGGQQWQVPAELPWDTDVMLEGIEQVKGSNYHLAKDETNKLLTMFYGVDAIQAWNTAGVGMTRRMAVLEWTMSHLASQARTPSTVPDEGGDSGN